MLEDQRLNELARIVPCYLQLIVVASFMTDAKDFSEMSSDPNTGEQDENRSRLPASRVRPRAADPEPTPALTPDEVLEPGQPLTADQGPQSGTFSRGSMFAPRSFAGGKVQVFGCSPGFLIISLIASILLTILLNALL